MLKRPIPYQATVFVCTNTRDGKVACANPGRGGAELCAALKEEVKTRGLKSKIRVARSGCLDRCAEGPNIFIYPAGEWYCGARPEDLPEILSALSA